MVPLQQQHHNSKRSQNFVPPRKCDRNPFCICTFFVTFSQCIFGTTHGRHTHLFRCCPPACARVVHYHCILAFVPTHKENGCLATICLWQSSRIVLDSSRCVAMGPTRRRVILLLELVLAQLYRASRHSQHL